MLEKNGGGWERMDKGHFLLNVEVNERNRRKVLEGGDFRTQGATGSQR